MLHITNGESVRILQTGLPGPVVYWADTLHDGPVPAGLTLRELSRVRERFLATFFALPLERVSLAHRDAALESFHEHDEIVLWFEHDLYDQLQLIQILDWFSHRTPIAAKLSMVCDNQYLGRLAPAELKELFETRHPVTAPELSTARAAWSAFRGPEPSSLTALCATEMPALPYLRAALIRHCEQFPAMGSGLSRTERQLLESLLISPLRFDELFAAVQQQEDAVFLGDATFRCYLEALAHARRPLLNIAADRFEITEAGAGVLAGRLDHVEVNGINCWRGGVHLCPGAPLWRWDQERRRIVP